MSPTNTSTPKTLSKMEEMQALADAQNARWVMFLESAKLTSEPVVSNGMDVFVQAPKKTSPTPTPVRHTLAHPVSDEARELKLKKPKQLDVRAHFSHQPSHVQHRLDLQYEINNRVIDRKKRWKVVMNSAVPVIPFKPVPIFGHVFAEIDAGHQELNGASFYSE